MRKWTIAAVLMVALTACGSDDESSTDSTAATTVSPWRFADEEQGELRANQLHTDPEQIANAAAQRELEDFVNACTADVPKLAAIGNGQGTKTWNRADQKEKELVQVCTTIGRSEPEVKASIEKAIRNNREELRNVDPSAQAVEPAPTSTLDPDVAAVSVTCPPKETEAVGTFYAEFDVQSSSPTPIREWGIDYGDGRSYKAGSEAVAQEQLYWHNYYETGDFEVTVWIVDDAGVRTEGTCTLHWSN